MSSVPQDLCHKLNELESNEDVPVLKRVQPVCECLQRNRFGDKPMVKPRETLTHPSSLGVSAACWISFAMLVCLNVEQMALQLACVTIMILSCKLAASMER